MLYVILKSREKPVGVRSIILAKQTGVSIDSPNFTKT